jgi:hypothetical protein
MRATLGVQAGIGQPQALHRTAVQQMLLNDFSHVPGMHKAVPDGVGIDHHDRSVLALVETAQLIRPDLSLQPGVLDGVLERALQLSAALAGAAWTRCAFVAFVGADEDVMLELRHAGNSLCMYSGRCAAHRGF